MKKIILSALTLIAFSTFTNAQAFHIGAKLGANLDKIDGQSFKEGFQLGYHVGGFAEIDFSKTIGIQPEVLFSQTNTKTSNDVNDVFKPGDDIKLNYLSIPLLLRINASQLLTFHIGPQFGILMNNKESLVQNGKDAFKDGDFAMVAGAQINLKLLRVYGRYNIGLANINDIGNSDTWKSQQIQFGVGLKIL